MSPPPLEEISFSPTWLTQVVVALPAEVSDVDSEIAEAVAIVEAGTAIAAVAGECLEPDRHADDAGSMMKWTYCSWNR